MGFGNSWHVLCGAGQPMARFRYKARDRSGSVMTGVLDSSGRDAVALHLGQLGYLPVRIQEAAGWDWREVLATIEQQLSQVTLQDKIVLTRQMATLIEAGLSFVAMFDALVDQAPNLRLKGLLSQVRSDVEGGMPFSDALAKHPAVFDDLYVSMVRAGESAGVLDEMLDRLAYLLEHEAETRARIQSATRYPKIVVVALVVAFAVLVTFVIPRFAGFYTQYNAELPLPTRMMIGVNHLVQAAGVWIAVVGVAASVGAHWYIRSQSGRPVWDAAKLRFPIFGTIFLKSALSKFARVFGTLNRCGLPVMKALEIASKTVDNVAVSRAANKIQEGALQGRGLVQPMKTCGLFPAGIVQMVAIGEQTGKLDEMLAKVSDYYDREVDYAIKNLSASLEPILLTIIGGAVLFLALAVFMPWWNMINVFKGGG
jgi:type II secretory pathway component PulF